MAVQEIDNKAMEVEQRKAYVRLVGEKQRSAVRAQRLESLQQDNHFEDPHKNLVMAKNVPQFDDSVEQKSAVKKSRKQKLRDRWKKSFGQALAEEDRYWAQNMPTDPIPNYFSAEAPKSLLPPLSLCSVCTLPCNMKCVTCEERFCCKKCFEIHKEMRCLKRVQ